MLSSQLKIIFLSQFRKFKWKRFSYKFHFNHNLNLSLICIRFLLISIQTLKLQREILVQGQFNWARTRKSFRLPPGLIFTESLKPNFLACENLFENLIFMCLWIFSTWEQKSFKNIKIEKKNHRRYGQSSFEWWITAFADTFMFQSQIA